VFHGARSSYTSLRASPPFFLKLPLAVPMLERMPPSDAAIVDAEPTCSLVLPIESPEAIRGTAPSSPAEISSVVSAGTRTAFVAAVRAERRRALDAALPPTRAARSPREPPSSYVVLAMLILSAVAIAATVSIALVSDVTNATASRVHIVSLSLALGTLFVATRSTARKPPREGTSRARLHFYERAVFEMAMRGVLRRAADERAASIGLLVVELDDADSLQRVRGDAFARDASRALGEMLWQNTRHRDLIGRESTGRFVALLPDAGEHTTAVLASRIANAGRLSLECDDARVHVSVSVGCAVLHARRGGDHESGGERLRDAALRSLALAKRAGSARAGRVVRAE
jgi:GGDEF domain-containing protein